MLEFHGTAHGLPYRIDRGNNPLAGQQFLVPRADAADPQYFWRRDGKARTDRAPSPMFLKLARHFVGWRDDASASLTMAFARAMEHRIAKVYAIEFARYRYQEFFPSSTEIDPGAMAFSYRMVERIGNVGLINSGNARDLPRISLGGQETQMPVVTYGAAYGFNLIEEKSAALANIALEDELAKATREAFMKFADATAAVGISGTDIVGVTNAPGVAAVPKQSSGGTWQAIIATIASASTSQTTLAAEVAVQQIAMDLLTMKQTIATQTLERQEATDCLLPTNLYQMLDSVPRSPRFTDDTLLEYLEKLTGLEISSWNALQNAGLVSGSTLTLAGTGAQQKTRIMVYDKDPEVVQWMEAQSFIQLAPQLAGLEYTVPCYERSGGIMVVRPPGMVYMDGC